MLIMWRDRNCWKGCTCFVFWVFPAVILVTTNFVKTGVAIHSTVFPTNISKFIKSISVKNASTTPTLYEDSVITKDNKGEEKFKTPSESKRNHGDKIVEMKAQEDNLEFVAEWEHKEISSAVLLVNDKSSGRKRNFPSPRIGPGTWHDGLGNWWIFGGQHPTTSSKAHRMLHSTINALADLWMYNSSASAWHLIFQPEESTRENVDIPKMLVNPTICGNKHKRKFAVWGQIKSMEDTNKSPLNERTVENTKIWTFDTNTNMWASINQILEKVSQGNIDNYPTLTRDTLLWCSGSGIMALEAEVNTKNISSGFTNSFNWWKYDLDSSQWLKLPPVRFTSNSSNILEDPLNFAHCQAVSTRANSYLNEAAYIICPGISYFEISVFFLDLTTKSVALLGSINVTDGFTNKEILSQGVLSALSFPDQNFTILLLAYKKSIDLWIHEHSRGKLYPVKNIWNGNTLNVLKTLNQFYKLSVSIQNSENVQSAFILNTINQVDYFEPNDKNGYLHFTIVINPNKQVLLRQRNGSIFVQRNKRDVTDPTHVTYPTEKDVDFGETDHLENPANIVVSDDIYLGENSRSSTTISEKNQDPPKDNSVNKIDPVIFFVISLCIFAGIGVFVFIRRCVQCPIFKDRGDDTIVLNSEPPRVRYSGIPGDFPFHTPLV